jgi:hypothetical protein
MINLIPFVTFRWSALFPPPPSRSFSLPFESWQTQTHPHSKPFFTSSMPVDQPVHSPQIAMTSANCSSLRDTSGTSLGNKVPSDVKPHCTNCGTTHTALWRRGLNDELCCNACGLYAKLVSLLPLSRSQHQTYQNLPLLAQASTSNQYEDHSWRRPYPACSSFSRSRIAGAIFSA